MKFGCAAPPHFKFGLVTGSPETVRENKQPFGEINDGRTNKNDAGPIHAFVHFNRLLKQRGIDLVVAFVPCHLRLFADQLVTGMPKEEMSWPGWDIGLLRLLEEDVEVIDLLDAFKAHDGQPVPVLHRGEHHWATPGIKIAARLIAERLQRYEFVRQAAANKHRFSIEHATMPEQIMFMEAWWRWPDELIKNVLGALDLKTPVEVVLFDGKDAPFDPRSPVALVGDSQLYHMNKDHHIGRSACLASHLAKEIGMLVDSRSRPNIITAPQLFFESSHRRGGKRVLVMVSAGPGQGWRLADPPTIERARVAQDTIIAKARVLKISQPPDPGKTIYKDAISVTEYEILEVEQGAYTMKRVLVLQWVMRNHKLTGAARVRKGEEHRLTLRPWVDAVAERPQLDAIQLIDDTENFESELFWVLPEARAPETR